VKRKLIFEDPIFPAGKRARSDSMDTQPGGSESEDTVGYAVGCCKCENFDDFECLQSAYDYGWFEWDGDHYCPSHAEEGIYAEEKFAEDREILHTVSVILCEIIEKV